MVATVLIREKNGAGETPTDKTSGQVRFKVADDPNIDLNDPVIIPASGQNHSMEKWLRLHIGGTPPDTQITNLTLYTDGANGFGTGVSLYYALDDTYSAPVIPSNANAIPQHDGVAMASMFTLTYGSPEALGAGPFSAANTDIGDYVVMVLTVSSTASPGVTSGETITFSYDEI